MFNFFNFRKNYSNISMQELYQLYQEGKVNILDVRSPAEYVSGHISGSKNLPLDQVASFKGKKDQTYYLVCQSGARSVAAAQFLNSQGYDTTVVNGRLGSWPEALRQG